MGILIAFLVLVGALILISTVFSIAFALLIPVLIWAFTGWVAGLIVNGRGSGFLGDMLLGLIGGIVGGMLFNGGIIAGVVGAVIVIFVWRLINQQRVVSP